MENIEDIYHQALEMLKQGNTPQEVLGHFSECRDQLQPFLELSTTLLSLPRAEIPQPAMQRKYLTTSGKRSWLTGLHISKFTTVSMTALLLLVVLTGTGYAALNSAPGQALFALKKTAEQAEVLLAYNQQAKANIEVAIAQQRLAEAQEIFNNPSSGPQEKAAALAELSSQTSAAITQVSNVTKNSPQPSTSQPLLNSLENLNQQQRSLLSQIKPDSQIKQAANSALASLDTNTKTVSKLKQYVSIAASDQSLTKLAANPNSVAVLGNVNSISPTLNQITVEKTTFTVTPQTSITDTQGNTLSLQDLSLNEKVNAVGTQNQNGLVAQQILVTSDIADNSTTSTSTVSDSTPQVKGASTSTTYTATASTTVAANQQSTSAPQASSSYPEVEKPDNLTTTSSKTSISSSTQSDSGQAVGGFILEDPNPQFIGNNR